MLNLFLGSHLLTCKPKHPLPYRKCQIILKRVSTLYTNILCDIISYLIVFSNNTNKMAPWMLFTPPWHVRRLNWMTWFPKLIIILRTKMFHYFYLGLNSSNARLFQPSWLGVSLRISLSLRMIWYKVFPVTPHWHFAIIPQILYQNWLKSEHVDFVF